MRAVVFDLDGTLVDSYEGIAGALNAVLIGRGIRRRSLEEVRNAIGYGLDDLLGRYLPPEAVSEGAEHFRTEYAKIVLDTTTALPGAVATLRALHERGFRLAVASNKPEDFSRRILDHLALLPYLTSVRGPSAEIPAKPHPAMLLECLRDLDAVPDETAYVGDMVLDVETARNAGVRVVLVPTGSGSRDALEETGMPVLDGLDGLLAWLPRWPRSC